MSYIKSEKELDLHKVRHDDVNRLVENFVLLNRLPLKIITGNSQRMRELAVEVLKRYNFDYEYLWNMNTIIVIIYSLTLIIWLYKVLFTDFEV